MSERELRHAFPGHDFTATVLSLPYPPRADQLVASVTELARLVSQ